MKILYTATVLSHICQFHLPHIKAFKERGDEVHVAAHNNLAVKNGLELKYADKFFEVPFFRSPFDLRNFKAFKALKSILKKEKYDYIVCNTPVGGILTRLAAAPFRKKGTKVIYIAHGFHFYKGASKKNWLIFYPIEKLMAKFCDIVITITEEDFKLAKEKFNTNIQYIHGVGVNEEKYTSVSQKQIADFKSQNGYNDRFVVLCTGELNANKNQKTIISAVEHLKDKYPNILLLLAGNGPNENNLKEQIESSNLGEFVKLLGYRTDLELFTNSCDLVVSASLREGLPLNIMEAMLCKKAVVASNNRGHRELVAVDKTGFLVDAVDSKAFAEKIELFMNDAKLAEKFGEAGREYVIPFTAQSVNKEFMRIFE